MKTKKQILSDVYFDGFNCRLRDETKLNEKYYSEEEILDVISATTIKLSKYNHEGYIDAELLKLALFKNSKTDKRIKRDD